MPKTTDKPPFTVVASASTGIAPPRQLGRHGMDFWERVQREFAITDVGGQEILMQCCLGIDRAESLAEIIVREGEVIRTRTGTIKSHPAVRDEISARAFVLRAITKLGIDLEPQKAVGRPPRSYGWRGDE